ncbi:MAG: carbohydrate kinase [Phycisphaeraceae bacterium]|nr:carbohydrate kinase [Phycisphaeraceae bacterium]
MTSRFTIVGLGEALFDTFPTQQVLGGAPLNVAVHAHQLAQARGGQGVVVSRVGQDALGARVAAELRQRDMTVDYLQTDPDHPTGEVIVDVDDDGQPAFEIAEDSAWDWLQFDPDLETLARRADAVCFGTLAQRNAQARNTIYRFLSCCRSTSTRLFDVNLRQFYYSAQILQKSCELANIVKLNDQELLMVLSLLGIGGPEDTAEWRITKLIKTFSLRGVVLTRGAKGTQVFTAQGSHEDELVSYPMQDGADAVGAGDACSAAILVAATLRLPIARTVKLANHCGAFVAASRGATPTLPDSILQMLQ